MNMEWNWAILVSLLVIQSANVKCQEQPSTVGADDGSSNRRRPLTDPENEHIGKPQPSGGLYFDTADWSKEAEKWSFKGGDWGLVTLPDDDYPYIPEPSVPGPVLVAEGNSMKKVIVSRSLTGLENVSLHFSYFLTNNPESSPQLQVVQLQGDRNYIVWSSDLDIDNVAYGLWTDGSVTLLPFNGNFEIKFIGQRLVDKNHICLDDIVLRGTYMNNKEGDGVLREDVNVTDTQSFVPQSENITNSNDTQVVITTVSSENIKNNVTNTEDQVSSNSSMVTESPVLNGTGTSAPDVSNQNITNAPDNFTSNAAPNNDNGTAPVTNLTTLDTLNNTIDALVNMTTVSDNNNSNQTVSPNMTTATSFDNETVANNATDNPRNVSTDQPSQSNLTISSNISTTAAPFSNDTVGDNSTQTLHNVSTEHPFQNITSHPSLNITTLPSQNNITLIQNITNPPNNISTTLAYTTNNASIFVPGGIEGTGSPPVEEASWGVFKILLTITALGGCILFYLYWRRKRHQDDEIALFSRGTYADYNNPTFHDDISPDEELTGRGNPSNYKSFN